MEVKGFHGQDPEATKATRKPCDNCLALFAQLLGACYMEQVLSLETTSPVPVKHNYQDREK